MSQVIIYKQDNAVSIIYPTSEALGLLGIDAVAKKDVPVGVPYEVVDVSVIPTDRTFRNAWFHASPNKIEIDLPKAKLLAHDKRRTKRATEFAPLDVKTTIPAEAAAAEAARKIVRDKYDAMQVEIDGCTTVEELKAIVIREGL